MYIYNNYHNNNNLCNIPNVQSVTIEYQKSLVSFTRTKLNFANNTSWSIYIPIMITSSLHHLTKTFLNKMYRHLQKSCKISKIMKWVC